MKYADGCWHSDRIKCRGNTKKHQGCGVRLCQTHMDLAKKNGCPGCRAQAVHHREPPRTDTHSGRRYHHVHRPPSLA